MAKAKKTAKKTAKKKKQKGGSVGDDIKQSARRIWLAGLGALAVAEAEGSKAFKKLVKQGAAFEERAKPTVSDLKGKAKQAADKAADSWQKLESAVETKVSAALDSAGFPRQAHLDDLKAQVEELQAEIEKLKPKKPARKRVRKPAAKKTTARKTTRKPAARKTARKPAKKTTARKPAAKKTSGPAA